MQEAVDAGLLKIDRNELLPLILYVGTNLDREILKLLKISLCRLSDRYPYLLSGEFLSCSVIICSPV